MSDDDVATIANAVEKPAGFSEALERLAALTLHDEELVKQFHSAQQARERMKGQSVDFTDPADRKVTELGDNLNASRKLIAETRRDLENMRPAYSQAVVAAFANYRKSKAEAVLAAIADMDAAIIDLQHTQKAIEQAGGTILRIPAMPLIGPVRQAAEVIARNPTALRRP